MKKKEFNLTVLAIVLIGLALIFISSNQYHKTKELHSYRSEVTTLKQNVSCLKESYKETVEMWEDELITCTNLLREK